MATVEIELRRYKKRKTKLVDGKKVVVELPNADMPLVLRVTSGKVVTRKNTGLYIKESEWDENKRRVNRRHPRWAQINDALDALCKEAEGVKAEIIKDRQMVTGKAVVRRVFATNDFYEVAQKKINGFSADQASSRGPYETMVARLKVFAPKLSVEEITPEFLREFKTHLETRGQEKDGKLVGFAYNTVVATLTKLKAVLNTVELRGDNPFDKVPIGGYRRSNARALTLEEVQKIRNYLPVGKWQRIAKDTFLFSFYAAGMRSSDVLQLRWADIEDGRIEYQQHKKRNQEDAWLSVPLNPITSEILSRYDRSTETVFDVLTMLGGSREAFEERESVQSNIGKNLKLIAQKVGITKPINFKLARTSFGQIANEVSGRNVYGIQQSMGHSNIKTTEIYLGVDRRAVDELLKVVYG